MPLNRISLAIVILLICSFSAQAGLKFQSSEHQTILLELYTSEGCSSCPPAEVWLSALKQSEGLWRDFVPVAFHVDYWDDLGWRDRWSSKEFSDRQRAYVKQWRSSRLFTPCFVLNGKAWYRSDRQNVPSSDSSASPGVLTLFSANARAWHVTFEAKTGGKSDYELSAALLACGLQTEVKGGENHGRKLAHDFVVLKLQKIALSLRNNIWEGDFITGTNPPGRESKLAVTAWVSETGNITPLQCTGGWLRDEK
jgi:hypothetical protein